jgi:hypothetical protein
VVERRHRAQRQLSDNLRIHQVSWHPKDPARSFVLARPFVLARVLTGSVSYQEENND